MLNKNQSNKRNYWKYALVLPLLGAFLFFFQVEIVAQEKAAPKQETKPEQIELKAVETNRNNTAKIDGDSLKIVSKNEMPIKITDKEIFVNGAKVSQEEMDKLDPNDIERIDVSKKSDKGTIRIVTNKFYKTLNDNTLYINNEKVDTNELLLLDQNTIDKMDVNKNEKTIRITTKTVAQLDDKNNIRTILKQDINNQPLIIVDGIEKESGFKIEDLPNDKIKGVNVLKGKLAEDKYGEKGKNGVIEISTKTKNEASQDKSDIENTGKETVLAKEQWLETYKSIMKVRFSLEKMKAQKEQAKAELEKSRKALKSKLFS